MLREGVAQCKFNLEMSKSQPGRVLELSAVALLTSHLVQVTRCLASMAQAVGQP